MQVQPYLFFDGSCEQALDFYAKAVGAQPGMKMYFRDAPDQSNITPASRDKVMLAEMKIGDSVVLVSDGHCGGAATFEGFSLTLSVADKAEAEQRFAALSAGGEVTMPLGKTFFAGAFGMLKDRFGVGWIVIGEPMGG